MLPPLWFLSRPVSLPYYFYAPVFCVLLKRLGSPPAALRSALHQQVARTPGRGPRLKPLGPAVYRAGPRRAVSGRVVGLRPRPPGRGCHWALGLSPSPSARWRMAERPRCDVHRSPSWAATPGHCCGRASSGLRVGKSREALSPSTCSRLLLSGRCVPRHIVSYQFPQGAARRHEAPRGGLAAERVARLPGPARPGAITPVI